METKTLADLRGFTRRADGETKLAVSIAGRRCGVADMSLTRRLDGQTLVLEAVPSETEDDDN